MKVNKLVLAVVLCIQAASQTLLADATTEQIEALKQQIEQLTTKVLALEQQATAAKAQATPPASADSRLDQLDQQVRVLECKRELDQETATEKAKQTPRVSFGANGFAVSSADSNYTFRVRGYVQADARFYPSDRVDTTATDTFLIRRARPIFEGTAAGKLDYRVMLDFGAQSSLSSANNALLQDAYATLRLWPGLQIQGGKFKEPVGLERLQSGANLLFIERAYPTQLVPNRDVGFQLQGDLFADTLRYEIGAFNGVADGGSGDFETADNDKDVAGRLFAQPFKNAHLDALRGLGFGVAGTTGNQEGALRPFVSSGLQRFFTYRTSTATTQPNVLAAGGHWRVVPQAYYYWGPFGLLAEYAVSSSEVRQSGGGTGAGQQQRLTHTAWQVAASYFVTGEQNSFRAVAPKRAATFSEGSGWGALELAARVGQLNVDKDAFPVYSDPAKSASGAFSYALGANWHLNRNLKLSLNWEHTTFDAPSGNPYHDNHEDVILTRAQFSF
ncbi:MAG TPA: porin [Verrucomicrobiae bacterium]